MIKTELYIFNPLINIKGVRYHYSMLNSQYPLHKHDYHELELVLEGTGEYIVNGVRYDVYPGFIWGVDPQDYHRIATNKMKILNMKLYHPNLIEAFAHIVDSLKFPIIGFIDTYDEIKKLIELADNFMSPIELTNMYNEEEKLACAMLYLIKMLKNITEESMKIQPSQGAVYVRDVIDWLNKNYDKPVHLCDAANAVNISPSYLSSLFMDNAGITFNSMLRRIRVDNAIKMLLSTNMSVLNIAEKCGFGCISSMNRAFIAIYQRQPSSYRYFS